MPIADVGPVLDTMTPIFTCASAEARSEVHTSELQSPYDLVCRLLHEKKNYDTPPPTYALVRRDTLFRGFEALRIIPVGSDGESVGLTCLLAHSVILGPTADSSFCDSS